MSREDLDDKVIDPRSGVEIEPGMMLDMQYIDHEHHNCKTGALWVWQASPSQHFLLQASHAKDWHRVHAVFWTNTAARIVRTLLENGMKSKDLAIYRMLRDDVGLIPMNWGDDKPKRVRKPVKSRKR